MDVLRHFRHAQTFRLLVQDLSGRLTVERLADHLPRWPTSCSTPRSRPAGRSFAGADAPAAALRDHRLRQARRQGAGLRLRPRPRVPVRHRRRRSRCRRARVRVHAARAAAQHLAHQHHAGGPALRHRPAAASRRRQGPARVEPARLRALPARAGVDVGAPGADARALRRRRRRRRATRSRRRATRSSRMPRDRAKLVDGDRRDAPEDARGPSQPDAALRPQARPGRHGRHRVHRAVPRARARAPARVAHAQRSATSRCCAWPASSTSCRRRSRARSPTPIATTAACSTRCASPARRAGARGSGAARGAARGGDRAVDARVRRAVAMRPAIPRNRGPDAHVELAGCAAPPIRRIATLATSASRPGRAATAHHRTRHADFQDCVMGFGLEAIRRSNCARCSDLDRRPSQLRRADGERMTVLHAARRCAERVERDCRLLRARGRARGHSSACLVTLERRDRSAVTATAPAGAGTKCSDAVMHARQRRADGEAARPGRAVIARKAKCVSSRPRTMRAGAPAIGVAAAAHRRAPVIARYAKSRSSSTAASSARRRCASFILTLFGRLPSNAHQGQCY